MLNSVVGGSLRPRPTLYIEFALLSFLVARWILRQHRRIVNLFRHLHSREATLNLTDPAFSLNQRYSHGLRFCTVCGRRNRDGQFFVTGGTSLGGNILWLLPHCAFGAIRDEIGPESGCGANGGSASAGKRAQENRRIILSRRLCSHRRSYRIVSGGPSREYALVRQRLQATLASNQRQPS